MTAAWMIIGALAAGGDPDTAGAVEQLEERFPVDLIWDLGEDAGGTAFMDALDWMRLHPRDLNTLTADELLSIPRVTPAGAAAIIAFRKRGGSFRSVEDLRAIEGGGEMLFEALRPFVRVGSRRERIVRVRTLVGARSPLGEGAFGSQPEVVSRVSAEWGPGLEGGATFSRRAGERMEDALISAYATLPGSGMLTRVIAGDFDVVSAGGIALWRGPSTPGDVGPPGSYSRDPVAPHRGSDRGHFLRGVAAAVEFSPGWKGALFLSGRSYAAGVDTSGEAGAFFDGAYTSPAAASKRDALHENLAGLLIGCPLPGGAEAGMAMYASRFDRTFVPADPNRLSGNSAGALGVDAGWTGGHIALRGAWGVIRGGAQAFTCAASFVAPGGASAQLRYADFPPRFDNPHALADGGWGDSRNSRSVTAILRSAGTNAASAECRVEAFDHPAPTDLSPIPRRGVELTLIWKGKLPGGTRLTLRSSLRRSYESYAAADSLGRSVHAGAPSSVIRTFFSASTPPVSGVTFAGRCEFAGAAPPGAGVIPGILLAGEIAAPVPVHGTIGGRVSFFRADTYDARLYDREEALPGVLSAPPLYGRGVRWYVRLSVHPSARCALTCRYATTVRDRASCDALRVLPCDREIAIQADASL